jgi:glycosyltransferase involved in cell wall biosynthesis
MSVPVPVPVSVVVPCHRCAGTVGRAIASVRAQTAPPAEIVLVDDASGDDTLAALRVLAAAPSSGTIVRIVERADNGGAGSARNTGWDAATGDLVAFLDADDSWHPRKLELQAAHMRAHPAVAVTGHRWVVSPEGPISQQVDDAPGAVPVVFRDLLLRNRLMTSSAMLRRALPQRFPAGQRHMEDHRLWLDIARSGARIEVLDAVLAAFHKAQFGVGGLSRDLWAMERGELRNYGAMRAAGAIGTPTWAACVLWSLAKHLRRCAITAARGRPVR